MATTVEPATDVQKTFLRNHGIDPPPELSRQDARRLIQRFEGHDPLRSRLAREVREARSSPHSPQQLESAHGKRVEFWIDTCTGNASVGGTDEIHELYRRHGCLYCPPNSQQVDLVLVALDEASPEWEFAHPELFFETLGLNFPELRRH